MYPKFLGKIGKLDLVPTLCVGMPSSTLPRPSASNVVRSPDDAERRRRHSHAERGNEWEVTPKTRRYALCREADEVACHALDSPDTIERLIGENGLPAADGDLDRRRVALGLDRHLERFAARFKATTWTVLAKDDPDNWRSSDLDALNDPGTEILFNLRDVNVGAGLLRAASGRGGATDWELLTIQQRPDCWPRIRWFAGDLPVSNPFELAE